MTKSRVVVRDRGWNDLKTSLEKADGIGVKVGILQSAGDHELGGPTNAEVAAWNELGTGRIPSRPAFRLGLEANRDKIADALQEVATAVVESKDPREALTRTGLAGQAAIRDGISTLVNPPLSPVTIAKKGSSKPLIDTGLIRKSVSFEVVMGEEKP